MCLVLFAKFMGASACFLKMFALILSLVFISFAYSKIILSDSYSDYHHNVGQYKNYANQSYGNYSDYADLNLTRNYTDYYDDAYRIRFIKGITINATITFDIDLSIPLPEVDGFDGSIDITIPISISITNQTLLKIPYPDKPIKVPIFYPVFNLPKWPSFLWHQNNDDQSQYSAYDQPDIQYSYFGQPLHYIAKRSLAVQSTLHRQEIFNAIENTLDKHGFDGQSCLLRIICQLAESELVMESIFHEILEHFLAVSRGVDEDNLLASYLKAERYGQEHNDCHRKYRCSFSIFEKL